MRLLRLSNNGNLSLTEKLGNDEIPPYAILSHTWAAENEEVTFSDLKDSSVTDKLGYKKIVLCGEQAKRDGLQYFWVDTCCIDKANKGELAHAINSMFRWYKNAARCYVYLSDVYDQSGLCESRWFTRGWTLQELLAPGLVEFFSQDWERLGNKTSLHQQIHDITGIPQTALAGTDLTQFDIEERFSWNAQRHTKLEEDRIYSLLGIFDVYISPFYGEGANKARERLMEEIHKRNKCVEDIRISDPRDDKVRIESTKGGLLRDSYKWILENSDFQTWNKQTNGLLWIKGDPGKGKTMLICGIIDELTKMKSKTHLAFFFCQATDSRTNSATAVLRGLLYMLVDQQPSLTKHILKKHVHAGKALFEDSNAWIALTEILTNVLEDPNLNRTCLVIDGLDECIAEGDLAKLLQFVAQQSSSPRAKWIVSSRNWPEIQEHLEQADHKSNLSLELNAMSVSVAVDNYIDRKVSYLAQRKKFDEQTQQEVKSYLTVNAHDTFLWVALVCQHLEKVPRWRVKTELNIFPPGLNQLYGQMVQQIICSDYEKICKEVLKLAATAYQPITLKELASLSESLGEIADDLESIQEMTSLCGSFLTVRDDVIYFVHQSAKEFLINGAASSVGFSLGIGEVHRRIFLRSLQIMSRTLKRDIFELKDLDRCVNDAPTPIPDPLAGSRYSCLYWIDHLCETFTSSSANCAELDDANEVKTFIQERYLYWLEALSLCNNVLKGMISMTRLEVLVQGRKGNDILVGLVADARHFITAHKVAIERYPLQVYVSALLFSPVKSLVRQLFEVEQLGSIMIKSTIRESWDSCLQTIEGHDDLVNSVAFSHDSRWLASSAYYDAVKIWDLRSGKCLKTLEVKDPVLSIALSDDSKYLSLGVPDGTVQVWNISNGLCIQTLRVHDQPVSSVAFSSNSEQVASASYDGTVLLCDMVSGQVQRTLEHHGRIYSLALSHNSRWLASVTKDEKLRIWDTASGQCLHRLTGHTNFIESVSFSRDLKVASSSQDGTTKIWDVATGACLRTLRARNLYDTTVIFSHDSEKLVSGSVDSTIRIWEVNTGRCLQTLEGHGGSIMRVAFSQNSKQLVSSAEDGSIKIWDTGGSTYRQKLDGHTGSVNGVVFSPDSTLIASASGDLTIKIWSVGNGACIQTLKGHTQHVRSIIFSHDSFRLVSGSLGKTIMIWDISSGQCLQTLEGFLSDSGRVIFSHDSTLVAFSAIDSAIGLWEPSTSALELREIEGYSSWVTPLTFSHDSTKLASGLESAIKIWDTKSGACLITLQGHSGPTRSVVFSSKSDFLVSSSYAETIRIWDANTGVCLQKIHFTSLSEMSFDPTNSLLYTKHGAIDIGGSLGSSTRYVAEARSSEYQPGHFSMDQTWIVHNDKKVLWLPPEFRPWSSAISGKYIAIGGGSGKVWICSFK